MRRLFAEGAFSQAFVPVLSEYQATRELKAIGMQIGTMRWTTGTCRSWRQTGSRRALDGPMVTSMMPTMQGVSQLE